MSDIGYTDDVKVYGRKFHDHTASKRARGIASCEVFEDGRLITKNNISFERRDENNKVLLENRIRNIVESVHHETLLEIELMFSISEKLQKIKHAPSHVKMGLLFINNNLILDAISEFRKAIELNPQEIDAYNNLGLAYIKLKEYTEALAILSKAQKIKPDYPDIHLNIGITYFYEKQYEKAIDHIQTALKKNPSYSEARYHLAHVYMASILNSRMDSKLPPASIRVERALQQLQLLVKENIPGMKDTLIKIQKALKIKDVKSSVKILATMYEKIFPGDIHDIIGISFYLRFMYGGKSLTHRALKKFEKDLFSSIDKQGSYADLWNNLGIVHLIQCRNMFIQALNEFDKALEINPKFEKALKNKKLVENDGKEFLILLRAILK